MTVHKHEEKRSGPLCLPDRSQTRAKRSSEQRELKKEELCWGMKTHPRCRGDNVTARSSITMPPRQRGLEGRGSGGGKLVDNRSKLIRREREKVLRVGHRGHRNPHRQIGLRQRPSIAKVTSSSGRRLGTARLPGGSDYPVWYPSTEHAGDLEKEFRFRGRDASGGG